MTVTFANLVQIYRQSEFVNNSEDAVFCTNSAKDIELLKLLSSDDHFDDSGIQTISNELVVNQPISLKISHPDLKLGRLFDSFEEFVRGDITHIHNPKLSDKPYFVKSEKIAFDDIEKPQHFLNYEGIKVFLNQLISMASYSDSMNKKLIFFSKKTFELSIDASKQISPFCDLLRELNNEQLQLIIGFGEWLNDEDTSQHIDEKKSILAFVFTDSLPQNATIIDVLKNIKLISQAVQNQYALYLENFSYEKFVKKLAENNEKFVSKVNDTISKVLPQFLALPFLTVIPKTLKSGDNWLVYLALCLYCLICYLGLSNQKLLLDHLRGDVEDFERKGKIPENLKPQWDIDKARINKLLDKQKVLYFWLLFSVSICFLYILGKFILYLHILEIHCGS
ncbi:hypothetical protein [Phocoenobacter skyensis]|uniref:Uncharacterized protein n=1 Tax=Phocoenobacter skyensis TaxID=97481 RepID=A0ABT9JPN8_9PAST|nr:hypothetical protein [Pasteurella skyensis]MDP8080228.1 hypothetical protein [Pasteurella skyensis]MDP8086233.1 hypothetical protein [Pasteurella skyensis]